ncbi:uro-adherence factor A-like isoform X2 [Onthophagus taurus]|uniref:uro-adherence factor A-like isoform X2 n=1 Tax=Onthophagus taurus TaxID=166361 RepID=UPI0039BDB38D
MASEPEMVVKRVSVPLGLEELMETLTKEVLKKKPDDIYTFASEYFSRLLSIRNKANYKVPLPKVGKSIQQPSTNGGLRKEYTKNDVLKIKTATIGTTMKLKNEQPPLPIRRINRRNVKAKVDSNLSPRTPQNDNINEKAKCILEKRRLSKTLESKKRDPPKSTETNKNKLKKTSSKSSSSSTISNEETKSPIKNLINKTTKQNETSSMPLEKAAILIQSLIRSFITRRRLRKIEKSSENKEEIKNNEVDSIFGGDVQPSINKEIISEMDNYKNKAATKIQSVWRGHKIRKNVSFKSEKVDGALTEEQRRKAAIVIQALFRGYLSRKEHRFIPKVVIDDKERLSTLVEEENLEDNVEKVKNMKEEIEDKVLKNDIINEEKDLIKNFVDKDDNDVLKVIIEKGKDFDVSSETQPILIENIETQKNPFDLKPDVKNENLINTPEEETLKVIIENGVDVVEISSEPQEKNVEKLDVETIKRPVSKDSTTSADSVDTVIFSNNQIVTNPEEELIQDINLKNKEETKQIKEEQVNKEITRYLTTITEPLRRAFSAETPSTPQKVDKMLKERSLSAQETESPKYIYIPLRQYSEDGDNSPKNEIDKKPDIQIEPKIEKEIIIYSPNKEISEKSNGAITEYINSIIEPVKQKFSPNGTEFVSKKPTVVEPEYQYIPLRTYSEDKENLLNAANGKSYQERVEHHLKNGVEEKTVSEQIDDIIQEANQVVGHDKVSNLDSSNFESNDSRNKREVSFNEDKKESVCDEKISVNNFTKKDIEESKIKFDGNELNKVADTIKSDPQEKENSLNLNKLHKGDTQEELLKENQLEKTNIEEKNNVTKNKAKVEVEAEESASSNEISKNEENLIQENGGGKEIKNPKDDSNENNVNVAIKESKEMESKQSTDKSSFLEVSQVQELQNNSKLTENCLKNAPKTEIIKDVSESDANLIHHNMEPQITSKEKAEKDQGEKLNTDQSVKKENKLSESDLKLNNQDIKTSETCKSNLETGELSTDDTLDNIALDSLESESFPINTTQDEITKMGKEPLLQDSGMKDGVIQGSQDLNEGDVKKTELQNSNYDDDLSKKFKSMHDVDDVVHLSNAEKATEVDTKSQKEGEELKMEKNEVIKNDKLIHDVVSAAENLKNDVQLSNGEKVTEMESQKDGELELGKIEKTPAQDSNDGESSKSDKSIHDVVSSSGNVNNEVVQLSNTEKAVEVDIKSQKGDEMKLEKNEKTPAQDSNDGESSKSDKSIHDVASSSGNVNNDIIKLSNTEKVAEMKSQKDGELELGKNEKTPAQDSNDGKSLKSNKSTHDVDSSTENLNNDVVQLSNIEKAAEVDIKSQKGDELKLEKKEKTPAQDLNDGESSRSNKSTHDVISTTDNINNDVIQSSNTEKATEVETKSQKGDELKLEKKEKTPAQDLNDGESSRSNKSTHDVISTTDNINNDVIQSSNTEKATEVETKSQKGDELKLEKKEKTPAQDLNDGESSRSNKSTHDVISTTDNINNDVIQSSNTEKATEVETKSQKGNELKFGKNEETPAQDLNVGESSKDNKSTHDVDSSTENVNKDVIQSSNTEKATEVETKSQKGNELKLGKNEETPAQDSNDGKSSRSDKSTHDELSSTENVNNDVIELPNTEKATEVDTKSQKEDELKLEKNEKTPAQDSNDGELSRSNKSTHDVISTTDNINNDIIQSSNIEKATEVETKSQKGNELKLGKNEETPAQDSNDGKSSRSDKSTHDEVSSTENVNNDVIELSNTEKATEVDTKSQKEDELKLEKNEKTPAQDSNDGELSRSNKSTHDVISTTDNINYDIIQSSNIEKAAEVDAKSHKGEEVKLEKNEETPAQDSNDKLNDDLVSSTKNEKHNTKLCNIEKAGQINDETQKDDLKLEKVEMIPCESSDNRNESPKNDEPIHDILSLKKHDTKLSNVEKTQQEELYTERIELPNENESTHHLTTTDIISTQDRKGDDELSKKKGVNETEQDTNTDEIDGGNKNKKNESNDGILNNDKPEHLKKDASKVDVAEEVQELTKEINGKSKINETEENKSKSGGENRIAVTPNNKSHDIQLQNDNTQKIEYIELRKDIESNDTENKNKSDKKDETNSIKANQSSDSNLNINTEGLEKFNVKIEGKDKILKSTLQDPVTLKENQNIKENQINTKNASLNADSKSESNIRNRKEITTKQPSTLESVSEDVDIGENELKSSNNNSESSMDHGTTNLYMSTFKAPTFPISNGNITDNYKIYKLEHLGFGEDVEGRKSISPTEVNCSTSRSLPSLPEEDTQPDDVIKETDSVSESKSEPFYLHRQGDSPKLIASSDQEKAFSKAFQKTNGIKYDSVPIRGNLGSSGSSTEELNCESNIDSRHNKPSSPHPSVQCNISVVDGSSPTSALPLALEMSQSAGAAFVTETTLSGAQAQNCASARDQADIDQNEHQQRAESVVVMDTVKRNNSSIIKKTPEQQAATKIQASFRGYQVRKKLKNKTISPKSNGIKRICRRKSSGRMDPNKNSNKKPTDLEQQSATKIQAGVRGFLVRRRQKKNKSVPESP